MPNYYAHLKFGGKVLEALPQGLADAIAAEREAFDLGCLGPDPLFFYQPLRPNAVRREGVRMHRRSALPAAERLRQAVVEGQPQAHLPAAPEDGAVWQAAARAFVHASPGQVRQAYRAMTFLIGFLARSCGTKRGRVIGAVSHMLPIRSAKGIALKEEPHPSAAESNADLDSLLERAVEETAEQLGAFFRAVAAEEPVPAWFDRDFKGNPPHIPSTLRWQEAHSA